MPRAREIPREMDRRGEPWGSHASPTRPTRANMVKSADTCTPRARRKSARSLRRGARRRWRRGRPRAHPRGRVLARGRTSGASPDRVCRSWRRAGTCARLDACSSCLYEHPPARSAATIGAFAPNACVALAHPSPLAQIARAGSIPRSEVVAESQLVIPEQEAIHRSPASMLSSVPSSKVEEKGRAISWGGEEIRECEYPDSHLWVNVYKQRGAIAPNHPPKSPRVEKNLVAILALVFADTLRREAVRDYGYAHKHRAPIVAPVDGAESGDVYLFIPYGHCGSRRQEGAAR